MLIEHARNLFAIGRIMIKKSKNTSHSTRKRLRNIFEKCLGENKQIK